ncbi:MBL fold metallo-hydrolase [Actinokineospora sp.]|uniref:MBL fold metallo-hydrolase n=1 Tax=Actinokineospora sp. TaxID=1872133 RepID=UPI0040381EA5
MNVVPVIHEGLGNSSYLLDLGDGRAAVIDPQRDPRPYLRQARGLGLTIAFALETHVHADFVSGSRELAARGARIVAAAAAGLAFEHIGLSDGQRLDLGDLALEAVATPGHTPAHLAWLLRDGDTPAGLFTGGALVVGGVARTDLAGVERTDALARAAYRSLRDRLLTLPDELAVWPTHGPGSFCSAATVGERTSTLGREKQSNPLLAGDPDEDEFVARLLGGLGSYPSYFTRMPEYNSAGPRVYHPGWPDLRALAVPETLRALRDGAQMIDVRPIERFAERHAPGAISHELRPQFGSWLGWVADPARPLVFVIDADQDCAELVTQCLTVGFEDLAGVLSGGMGAWQAAGLPVAAIPLIGAHELGDEQVLDIRQDAEWRLGHIPHASHVELGDLARAGVPTGPITVMCAHGQRSMTAASLLSARRGSTAGLTVLRDSAEHWSAHTGHRLQEGL